MCSPAIVRRLMGLRAMGHGHSKLSVTLLAANHYKAAASSAYLFHFHTAWGLKQHFPQSLGCATQSGPPPAPSMQIDFGHRLAKKLKHS
jgi:hypothetical protein